MGAALVIGALIAAFAVTGLAGAGGTLAQPAQPVAAPTAGTAEASGAESATATPEVSPPPASDSGPVTPGPVAPGSATPSQLSVPKKSRQAQLAAVPKIPNQGPGTYRVAHLTSKPVGKPYARRLRYAVRVEKNLPYEPDEIAAMVVETLGDQRSWIGSGEARLQLVADPNRADFTINLATPGTVDRTCWPLRTWGRLSCQAGNKVMLNAWRWAHGAKAYGHDLTDYRRYLINHEVGHRLGHGHVGCPAKGRRAPVMMQQTKGVGACRANPWPNPTRGSARSDLRSVKSDADR